MTFDKLWKHPQVIRLVELGLQEDFGQTPHSSLTAIPKGTKGVAQMIAKSDGIVAGLPLANTIFQQINPSIEVEQLVSEGQKVIRGTILMKIQGESTDILSGERLILNFIQRLSGIATVANHYAELAKPYGVKILDTRKTTPGMRLLEKYAVKAGGAENHRIGLFDMIMLKDNHIDFCGSITQAIHKTLDYLKQNKLQLKIEIETRNLDEVKEACAVGNIHRIMLDNFSPSQIIEALKIIDKRFETEASGGITDEHLLEYLKTGVDYISVGALTHSVKSMDISLKTIIQK
ncbi:MAG: carboxylating nicotinate-nucleotide diphosphorylase [Bacteroidia bacterium]|nr:carboxylating nicotinate-nucleotide diphosphorylase [Bacteroidia bacterium]MCO5253333.1 carboxylating nicotinate-nucleotide diphosphorylase [Bacteroidota bacterium]MCZ2130943.1 carboxylating nicotinate-nucleotide diphosphorylase [Bacteroidia bacterium]